MNHPRPDAFAMQRWLLEPMAIEEGHWAALMDRFNRVWSHTQQGQASDPTGSGPNYEAFLEHLQTLESETEETRRNYTVDEEGTATVLFEGVVGYRIDEWMKWWLGMVDLADFQEALLQIDEDETVKRTRVKMKSPGGSVIAVEETMILVARLAKRKPIVFETDALIASAAYFIASQGSEIRVTRSAQIGSLGVIMGVYDFSDQAKAIGVKPIVFRSGDLKAPGFLRGEKITEKQIKNYQDRVIGLNAVHDSYVIESRPALSAEFKDGRVVTGSIAVSIGMADALISI